MPRDRHPGRSWPLGPYGASCVRTVDAFGTKACHTRDGMPPRLASWRRHRRRHSPKAATAATRGARRPCSRRRRFLNAPARSGSRSSCSSSRRRAGSASSASRTRPAERHDAAQVTMRARDLERLRAALERAPVLKEALGMWPRGAPVTDAAATGRRPAGTSAVTRNRGEHAGAAASMSAASSSPPSAEPSSGSTACSGCGIRPEDVPGLVRHACDVVERAVRRPPRSGGRSGRARRARTKVPSSANQAPSPCLTGMTSSSPTRAGRSERQSVLSTRRSTSRQTNSSCRFGRRIPGRRPASQRIWKPLQMPSTGPPRPRSARRRPWPARGARSRP